MKRFPIICAIAVALLALALAPAAQAQATRTWVSGVGDDANPCSRTAPCKTFAGAISKTAANGEISVLDPGGYGAVTITKAITINGEGTLGGILASLVNGIIVNAGVNDRVIIRNISINGAGNGINGIRYLAGRQLTVENVTINGFTGRGIDVALTAAGNLFVKDVNITNVNQGIRIASTGAAAVATIDNVRIEGATTTGIEAATGSNTTIRNSVLSRNNTGILVSGIVTCNLDSNLIVYHDAVGLNVTANATVRITNNSILNNTAGLQFVGGASVQTATNNRIEGNGSSQTPNASFLLD